MQAIILPQNEINKWDKIYAKTEALVIATIKVSELINNQNDDNQIKKTALQILIKTSNIKTTQDVLRDVNSLLSDVTLITSLINIASMTGRMSDMNREYLLKGHNSFKTFLTKFKDELIKGMEVKDKEPIDYSYEGDDIKDIDIKDSNSSIIIKDKEPIVNDKSNIKDNLKLIKANLYNNIKAVSNTRTGPAPAVTEKINERRKQILAVFRPNTYISIKDISIRVRNCSEKTIQRELNSLVDEKILNRIGEKRWSKYGLVLRGSDF